MPIFLPVRSAKKTEMTLAKRIIPCLDVTAGRVVKGINFLELRDAGDPVEIARRYDGEGADELTFLDITASSDERDLILHIIEAVASQVFIPLTVGGGVRQVEDIRRLRLAGSDKVSINSAAVARPEFVREAAEKYGDQCIVVAIDAKADFHIERFFAREHRHAGIAGFFRGIPEIMITRKFNNIISVFSHQHE